MAPENQIGTYLRARRDQVVPEDVGLPNLGGRRVPGLRRDELSMLAGISTEYYTRLEQGRDTHPSAQVLDALAGALGLDDDAREYLHELARPRPIRRRRRAPEKIPAGIVQMIDSWPLSPAAIQGHLGTTLASNRLMQAISPNYLPGANGPRSIFLDPEMRELYRPDWDRVTESTVAGLRAAAAADVDDPELAALVGEMSMKSERFRTLWARHDARPRRGGGMTRLEHPQVGPLELHYEKLQVTGAPGLTLVVYSAESGSSSEQALSLLASMSGAPGEVPITDRGRA
jgi:transcriptional regulator with XRE-family HTH domain